MRVGGGRDGRREGKEGRKGEFLELSPTSLSQLKKGGRDRLLKPEKL